MLFLILAAGLVGVAASFIAGPVYVASENQPDRAEIDYWASWQLDWFPNLLLLAAIALTTLSVVRIIRAATCGRSG